MRYELQYESTPEHADVRIANLIQHYLLIYKTHCKLCTVGGV